MVSAKKSKRAETRKSTLQRSVAGQARKAKSVSVPASAVLIGLVFVIVTSLVIIAGGQVMPWREGQRPLQAIRVRQTFQVLDEQLTEQARQEASESTPNYYHLNQAFLGQVEGDLNGLCNDLKAAEKYDKLSEPARTRLAKMWGIDKERFHTLQEEIGTLDSETFRTSLADLRKFLTSSNIIDEMPDDYQKVGAIILVDPSANAPRQVRRWTFCRRGDEVSKLIASAVDSFPTPLRPSVSKYLLNQLKDPAHAIWVFDKRETDKQRNISYKGANDIFHTYESGQILTGHSQVIRKRDLDLLKREHQAYWDSLAGREKFLADCGAFIIVTLIAVVVGVYCVKFQPRAIHNWTRSLALAVVLISMVILGRALKLGGVSDYTSVFEVVLVALVMTVAYNQRFALMITAVLACLLMIALQGRIGLLLAMLAGGTTVILILNEIRTRSKLIKVAFAAALMSFAVVWAFQLANYQPLGYVLWNAVWAAMAAFVAVFIFQGILPLIERLFQIATSMTLLEWCDASKPLLRRMTLDVPGTFHHAQLISSMSEAAAESVGANGLLARVGGIYHDVGKLGKPEYFVENQPAGNLTRHKDLSPAMSLLVIIGHVKDGLELAREYGLPKILYQFIGEHHGTTVVEYFYHLDSQKRSQSGENPISDVNFRYPGPKPRGKESGILMLADAAESATRALSEPTVGRIEAQVHQVVKRRVDDGQLDECELTLKDLHEVEESLTKSLWAMYHGRIKYPSQESPKKDSTGDEKAGTQ